LYDQEISESNQKRRLIPADYQLRYHHSLGFSACLLPNDLLYHSSGYRDDLQGFTLERVRERQQAQRLDSISAVCPHPHEHILPTMTIKEAQEAVDLWIKEYGVRYFSELTNMTVLTEEVGELARVMARKFGDQSFKEGEKDNLGEEMADVLWVLLCLANQTGVDLTTELEKSIEKKTQRDSLRHIHNKKLMA
jgi:NTP pyrophosphatase (non-canonical NTP hydrolase)